MNLIYDVSCAVRIHQLVIPHDLLAIRVILFLFPEFVSNFTCKLDLIGNFDIILGNCLTGVVFFSKMADSDCEGVHVGL